LDTVGIDSFNRSPKPKEHHWSPSSKKTGIMIKKLQEPFEKPNTLPKKKLCACIILHFDHQICPNMDRSPAILKEHTLMILSSCNQTWLAAPSTI